jgi:hypothetical protein
MAKAKPTPKPDDDFVFGIPDYVLPVYLIGTRPLIYNSVSQKAANELLLPAPWGKRRQGLKHDPLTEYRSSVYYRPSNEEGPTRLVLPSRMVKKALLSARAFSSDAPGEDRLKQCVTVVGENNDLYGVPKLLIARVTNSGKVAAPDMRTRAIVPQWCTQVRLRCLSDFVTKRSIMQCLVAAGMVSGLGDWRQEKGSGDYGTFRVTMDPADAEYAQILQSGLANAQDRALANPEPYDDLTRELLSYYGAEVKRRELEPKKTPRAAKPAGNGNATLEN